MLYNDSAFTLEGLTNTYDSYTALVSFLKDQLDVKFKNDPVTIYTISGNLMNTVYNLRGRKRYKKNLNIVCIKLSDMKNMGYLVMGRFQIGGRWFDDVVDNNTRL